jgi:hypothetical protein
MLGHGIIHASHVAGLLSLFDGVTKAIDVQVAKSKGDLEQEIVIISQLHAINVQQLHYHERFGCDRHLLNSLRGMQIYSYQDGDDAKDGNAQSMWWFSIDKSEIQDVVTPQNADQHGYATDQFKLSPPLLTAIIRKLTCLPFQYGNLIQKICVLSAV